MKNIQCVTIGLMLVCLLAVAPRAAAQACRPVSAGGTVYSLPASTVIDGSVAVGAPVAPWVYIGASASRREFSCTNPVVVQYGIVGDPPVMPNDYAEAGMSYSVYDSGVPGLGVVFRFRDQGAGGTEAPVRVGSDAVVRNSNNPAGYLAGAFYIRLIRTGNIPPGAQVIRSFPIGRSFARDRTGGTETPVTFGGGSLVPTPKASCQVRALDVAMGNISANRMTGIGSTAAQRSYEVNLDCEAGVGVVDFQTSPTTPVIDPSLAIAEVQGGATGIGLQFLDATGAPVPFLTSKAFGRGPGLVTQTFQVRYRQTEATVSPGAANGGLTIMLSYP